MDLSINNDDNRRPTMRVRQRIVRPSCSTKNGDQQLRWRCAVTSLGANGPALPTQSCPSSRCPLPTIIVLERSSARQDRRQGSPRDARSLPRRSKSRQGAFWAMRVSPHQDFCRRCAPVDCVTPSHPGRARRSASELQVMNPRLRQPRGSETATPLHAEPCGLPC